MAVKAKSVILLGTAVVGTLLMSFTTVEDGEEARKEASENAENVKVETVQVNTVAHNLDKVVEALAIIDPAWLKKLPMAKRGTVKKSATTVVYGVIGRAGGRLQLTPLPVLPNEGDCGEEDYPCRIQFDTTTLPIQEEGSDNFVDDDPGKYTVLGMGGYN